MINGATMIRRGPMFYKSMQREMEIKRQELNKKIEESRRIEEERRKIKELADDMDKKRRAMEVIRKKIWVTQSFNGEKALNNAPTIAFIAYCVSEYFNVSQENLFGHSHRADYVRARQVGYWLAHKLCNKSLPQIGKGFGGRDHTTILSGIRRLEKYIADKDQEILEAINAIRGAIEFADAVSGTVNKALTEAGEKACL